MVTAAALGQAPAARCYPVARLDAIAAAGRTATRLLVATDARRKEVYWAAYDEARRRIDGPHVGRPADLPRPGRLATRGRWSCADSSVDLAGSSRATRRRTGSSPRPPDAWPADPAPLTPLYLRRPDAGRRRAQAGADHGETGERPAPRHRAASAQAAPQAT